MSYPEEIIPKPEYKFIDSSSLVSINGVCLARRSFLIETVI